MRFALAVAARFAFAARLLLSALRGTLLGLLARFAALRHAGVNLRADPPSFFSRFERLAEIVGIDETDVEAGRTRFRFYRERGYELRTHSLAER